MKEGRKEGRKRKKRKMNPEAINVHQSSRGPSRWGAGRWMKHTASFFILRRPRASNPIPAEEEAEVGRVPSLPALQGSASLFA